MAYTYPTAPATVIPGTLMLTATSTSGFAGTPLENGHKYVLFDKEHFPELADADDVDIRRLMFGLMDGIYDAYMAITEADRPTNWVSLMSPSIDASTGNVTRNYYNQFTTTISGEEVLTE